MTESKLVKQPVLFVSHGGGPCFYMDTNEGFFADINKRSKAANFFRQLASKFLPTPPTTILVISAHWMTDCREGGSGLEVTSTKQNKLYFDYYGFPDYTYKIQYPAPGDVSISKRVAELVKSSGVGGPQGCQLNTQRGLDHGVFCPLGLIYPDAKIPVLQLSMPDNLDPESYVKLGEALEPLREQGVLIIGSGQATHNMRASASRQSLPLGADGKPKPGAKEVKFTNWLSDTVAKSQKERLADLIDYRKKAPESENAHPIGQDEHLLPLHVVCGAAGADSGKTIYNEICGGSMALHCFLFGFQPAK